MKKRNIAVLMLVIGVVLIVLGIGTFIYKELSNMNKEKRDIENKILNQHEVFRKNVDLFEETRNLYYSKVSNNLYPETVKDNYEDWITNLNRYTGIVDSVEKSSNSLKEHCVDKYYSNKNVQNKCESFLIAYETVINYYTKDVFEFNKVINEYRNINNINEDSEIKDYSLKYNYIDINSDGEFKGKD